MSKKEKSVIAPQKGSQELAMNIKADLIIYGGAAGSGKSHLMLMKSLPYINDPNYNASYFRRNTKQLTQQGGLISEAKKMYRPFKPKWHGTDKQFTFKSGATIAFNHLEHEKHKESYQGGQLSAVFFDELTHFSEGQFTYLLSRLRSDADVDGFAFASCNPKHDSWVVKWVEWWLDEEGYPDKEKQGVVRYYYLIDEVPVFADTAEELKELYPDKARVYNPVEDTYVEVEPKTFTFIAGTIFDNPILIKNNPRYLAELNSLPRVERAQLLDGCWYAIPEASGYFKRDWLRKASCPPLGCREVRAWDKASTEPSEVNRYPDFTASIKMLKDKNDEYYILGDYCPTNFDKKEPDIKGRFRRRSGDRDNIILAQAKHDGEDCIIVMPQDAGQAGATEFQESSKKLINEGFVVKKDPTPTQRSKLNRFTPFASACENGLVHIIESSFPDKRTLEYFYKELEMFDGERSSSSRKDDVVDCTASAFNYLARQKVLPKFGLGSTRTSTKISSLKRT
ncbi:MAG: putative terminase large subunit [Prokaryotic dsDNA virus sp.]|nr:MAG: putative terminase large subunit [Prokaryotic dsDNA virus sp.]